MGSYGRDDYKQQKRLVLADRFASRDLPPPPVRNPCPADMKKKKKRIKQEIIWIETEGGWNELGSYTELKRMDIREETSGTTGSHQWHKGPRLQGAPASWK
jgi:hypothetical protein